MVQGEKKFDESRLAVEFAKRIRRDKTQLNRNLRAVEEHGDDSAFLETLTNAALDVANDLILDQEDDNGQRITPNQPRNATGRREKHEPQPATRPHPERTDQVREANEPYQPFAANEETNPALIKDDSLTQGIYIQNDDEANVPQEEENDDTLQQDKYAGALAKNRQTAKRTRTANDATSRAAAFAKKHNIEAPIELEQQKQHARGAVANEGKKFGAALKKRIDEGDFNSYAIALSLAILKDVIDIPEQSGAFSWMLNIFVTASLYVIISGEYGFVKRIIKKFYYKRLWIMFFAELIPGIKFIPIMTLFILSMNKKIKNERRKNIFAYTKWKREKKRILRTPLFRESSPKRVSAKQAS